MLQDITTLAKQEQLATRIILLSFCNLLIVSLLGLLLRAFPFFEAFPLAYKNVLHGHSHFAFGGWILPILLALILKAFPDVTQSVSYWHWRNITVLLFGSAYGMLLAFPVQGYKAVSIFFSTVSVAAGYYLVVVLWKALRKTEATTSTRFLKAGLFYLALSAIGPFATGPLIAMGKQGTPLYFDSIYFYLHFQYNGWFTFAVLALLFKTLEQGETVKRGTLIFRLFNLACVPAFALSLLWNQPHFLFYVMGGAAALLQLVALIFLLKTLPFAQWKQDVAGRFFIIAILAFVVKTGLQVVSAFPAVASLGYAYRNFIISYLHLILLGFITVFCVAFLTSVYRLYSARVFRAGSILFLFSFLTTETLLIANASLAVLNKAIPNYTEWLFGFSCFFPAGIALMTLGIFKRIRLQKEAGVPLLKAFALS